MYNLLEKYRNGDMGALNEVIENFNPLILKEASRWRIGCYEYEDLVQHGYLSVIKAVNMFKGEESKFVPYCINAIKTNYKALLKGEIKHHREIPDENILNKGNEYMFTIEDEIIAYEKTKEIYEALDKLTQEEKQIINDFYIKNNSLNKVAEDTNKTYNSVRYTKDKAIKKLQKILEEHS
ncbi:sigma-70 family RNA polymerase sigma factor [Clostridium botulinum]|uniref:sigma-70 family RNA polymerase sigma factor n=1 Tax=Clostridium botulinum TaxID=1491 RepID=UPI0005F93F40|nr:sigma-70 family RNA polymerase sigma factor [Clostridium botulinum]KEI77772.1 RNA polymerase sigma factor [Clostridium botulinum A2 117]KEI86199.1 RNA polymerase sigma factor [Clostridium botulinum B2 267]MBN3414941.1 sigma-70 family RNA polymerase sigma factor [Clostridium botulinum]MBN3441234.1 sigma-70 family RNA polymerase sigma factor [Clostridium botulinum]MBY6798609.1 sigma-70 family RNA polymerase sigma factor [Clostridium botulinum]